MKKTLINKNTIIIILSLMTLFTSCSRDTKDEVVLGKMGLTYDYDDFIIWDYKFDCPKNWRKVYDPDFSYANSYTEDIGLWASNKKFKNIETSVREFLSYMSLFRNKYDNKDNNFKILSKSKSNNIEEFSGELYDDQGEIRKFIGYQYLIDPFITIIFHAEGEGEPIIKVLAARAIKSLRKIDL